MNTSRQIMVNDYVGRLAFKIILRVVELSHSVELIQRFNVKWCTQRETIFMTPEQTTQLMSLLVNKRKSSGFSVAEVAQRAGVDRGTVWRFEQGMIASPKAENLQTIGNVLGIPSSDLYAIVGWIPSGELPSFRPYLGAKYGQLPTEAVEEITAHFEAVARRYGVSVDSGDAPRSSAVPTSSDAPDPSSKEI